MHSSRRRRVKIIATLGPASADRETIAALFAAGADVFRINMSHASHDGMRERVAMIRSLEEEIGRPIGVLVDLQGPKLRLGAFPDGGADLHRGDAFVLDSDPSPGDQTRVYLPHPEILSSLAPGHRVLIDDGKVLLRVVDASPGRASTVVEVAGRVSSKKGVSLPDTTIPTSAMTDKDRADLAAALEENIDWIALSFVQRPEDVVEVKTIANGRALVMAKIEKPQAVQRLDEIMAVADALMVARGDLGVEMPLEQVPGIQKTLTRLARRVGKPVVVATQMLELMITSPVPTRAEVSDVATAVFEGADAVMLSAESASGQYPREAVATMNRIAEAVESEGIYPSIIEAQRARARAHGRRRDRRGDAPCRRNIGLEGHLRLDEFRLDRPSHRPPAAALGDPGADSARSRWRGASRSSGACIRSSPMTRATSATWRNGPAATPISKASPERAIASSSSPACLSAPRAQPTTCASRRSAGSARLERSRQICLAESKGASKRWRTREAKWLRPRPKKCLSRR